MNEPMNADQLAELMRCMPELEEACRRKKVMADSYGDAVKAVAHRCNVAPAVLSKFVAARVADNGEKVRAMAVSTADLFDLVCGVGNVD